LRTWFASNPTPAATGRRTSRKSPRPRVFKRTARRGRFYSSRQPERGPRARRRPLWPQPAAPVTPCRRSRSGAETGPPLEGLRSCLRPDSTGTSPRTDWLAIRAPGAAEATLVTSAPRSKTFFWPTRPRLPGTSPATSSRPPTLQPPNVAIIARAITTLWRAQDSHQARPRSLLSLMRLTVAFNVSYPKSEAPNQTYSPRLCSVRTVVDGSLTTKICSIRARPTFPTEHPTKRCLAGRESRA
jgi:hypothetical protein